ncbi:Gram-negative bacterial tonB protein [Aquimixticola soesokkakensis]|uniref:Gram-negative bacterial tonB protein n=1 Tax=Aquimixticola soesokkakensis TaxID=1519096 RepID=A0A1Y5T8T6_9RHOB|nr:TonB family protein [Aquimixticola soesokkakensis]SLN56580.1 Gram-negative bacterial tonB protein [Aquimixticola soesokkakensis]
MSVLTKNSVRASLMTGAKIVVFGGLALGVHVAAFGLSPQEGAAASAGNGGEDLLTMAAAPASFSQMVEQWETPPEVSVETPDVPPAPQMAAPELETPPPLRETVRQTVREAQPDMPQMAALAPDLPAIPTVDDTPPPPEMTQAPPEVARERPKARPDRKPEPPKPAAKAASKPQPKAQPKAAPKTAPKNAPKNAPASAPSKAQKAAGSGGGQQAGQSQSAQAATLSKSERNSLIAQWGARIRSSIDRAKRVPRGAGSGSVTLTVVVSSAGALQGVSVTSSSGNATLDAAAVEAVQRARKFPKAPKGLTGNSFNFRLNIQIEG